MSKVGCCQAIDRLFYVKMGKKMLDQTQAKYKVVVNFCLPQRRNFMKTSKTKVAEEALSN